MALAGGPVAVRDGRTVELTRYRQSGKVQVDGDTVTQQLGRGQTAEYSLSQLAAHSKDPEYFVNTMTYAAKRGDSVTIVHYGVSRMTDPALEHRLPPDFPCSDAILHAFVKHQIDPTLLAAVGEQESGMGKGAYYNQTTHIGADGHGHGMWQMDDRYYRRLTANGQGATPISPPIAPHRLYLITSSRLVKRRGSSATTAAILRCRTTT